MFPKVQALLEDRFASKEKFFEWNIFDMDHN